MGKHAFLIMAHKDDLSFRTLLQQIDDENSDIFIHMDSKNKDYDPNIINQIIKKSGIYHVERTNVTWGGFSQIKCELILLSGATKISQYDYYHLLSGQDLLISSLDNLYKFFDKNKGKEFINFERENFIYQDRVKYFYLQEQVGKNKNLFYYLNIIMKKIQKSLGIKRNNKIEFQKGTNWFSITDDLARFVLGKKKFINKVFKYTLCADEIFLQTIVHNSSFKENLFVKEYDNSMVSMQRLIDWERGAQSSPYTFKNHDFEELISTKMLFARKFDANVNKEVIKRIFNYYKNESIN